MQSVAAPAWASLAGGCRLDRDTLRAAVGAGFRLVHRETHVAGWIVEAALRSTLT